MFKLGFTVAKCTAYRESTREASVWSYKGVLFIVTIFRLWNLSLANLLRLCGRITILHDSLCLIDVATCIGDSLEFNRARGFVIRRKNLNL